jgi:hypothetical protein
MHQLVVGRWKAFCCWSLNTFSFVLNDEKDVGGGIVKGEK